MESSTGASSSATADGGAPTKPKAKMPKPEKKKKAFVFEDHPHRKIALRLAYHGHVHDGLAKQEETANTVETIVCDALKRVNLIPADGPHQFGRCGRTDKGVSALGNCVSMLARASCWPGDDPQRPPLDYASKLNGVLPPTVRVTGFAHVPDAFDARFSCTSRTYRYFFCHRGLDVAAMAAAARDFIGTHSFRNFCKMDVVNVSNFERTVYSAGIFASEALPELVSFFEIRANSFLYHQIRCTMEVLFLVGRGLEEPGVVRALLERGDRKPNYALADGTPLILWNCEFDEALLPRWCFSRRAFYAAEQEMSDIAVALLVRAAGADGMRRQLFRWYAGAPDDAVAAEDRELEEREGEGGGGGGVVGTSVEDPHSAPRWSGNAAWKVTGCDWTLPRTAELLKHRRRDLMQSLHSRPGGDGGGLPPGYVPLLDRDTEPTYEERVSRLGGMKRARYEVNEAKKAAGAAINAMARE